MSDTAFSNYFEGPSQHVDHQLCQYFDALVKDPGPNAELPLLAYVRHRTWKVGAEHITSELDSHVITLTERAKQLAADVSTRIQERIALDKPILDFIAIPWIISAGKVAIYGRVTIQRAPLMDTPGHTAGYISIEAAGSFVPHFSRVGTHNAQTPAVYVGTPIPLTERSGALHLNRLGSLFLADTMYETTIPRVQFITAVCEHAVCPLHLRTLEQKESLYTKVKGGIGGGITFYTDMLSQFVVVTGQHVSLPSPGYAAGHRPVFLVTPLGLTQYHGRLTGVMDALTKGGSAGLSRMLKSTSLSRIAKVVEKNDLTWNSPQLNAFMVQEHLRQHSFNDRDR